MAKSSNPYSSVDEDDDDSDVDPFSFKKHSFATPKHRRNSASSSSSSSSDDSTSFRRKFKPKQRKLSNESSSSADKTPKNSVKEVAAPRPSVLELSSSESDDDVDVIVVDSPSNRRTTRQTAASGRKPCTEIDKETAAAMKKAHDAKERLQRAQKMHLEVDDEMQQSEDDDVMVMDMEEEKKMDCSGGDLGEMIRLTIRKSDGSFSSVGIRMREPLKRLVSSYRQSNSLSSTTKIQLQFDGEPLNLDQTPQNYDMEDGDLIDADIQNEDDRIVIVTRSSSLPERRWTLKRSDPFQKLINVFLSEHKNFDSVTLQYQGKLLRNASTPMLEGMKGEVTLDMQAIEKIVLKLRINGEEQNIQEYKIGLKEPFQTLLDQFCRKNNASATDVKFMWDGETLSVTNTPGGEDMEDEDMIDVIWEKTTPPVIQMNHCTMNTNTPITIQTYRNKSNRPGKKIRLNITDTIQKLKQGYLDYYRTRGCNSVKFYYQDRYLRNENVTLQSLGMTDMDKVRAMENGNTFSCK